MKISKVLEEIFQHEKDLMIRDEAGYTVDILLDMITKVESSRFLVEAESDVADPISNAAEIDIDMNGYVIFYFVLHDEYYYLEKMKTLKDVEKFVNELYGNYFFEDIVLLKDGKVDKNELLQQSQKYRHALITKGW